MLLIYTSIYRSLQRLRVIAWRRLALRRRILKSLYIQQWLSHPIHLKILTLLDLPFIILRDLTIPNIDSELWSKFNVVIQPITCSLLLLLLCYTNNMIPSSITVFTLIINILIITVPCSVLLYYTIHTNKPPKSRVFLLIWSIFGFIMCVIWVYILATELVSNVH